MIVLHGYLLEGYGSNFWIRSVIRALCKNGQTVHLMCQENQAVNYDFISTVYLYHKNNKIEKKLERTVPYAGQCIMHKPILGDILPVFIDGKYEEFKEAIAMVKLPEHFIKSYITFNSKVLNFIVNKFKLKSIFANHAVLMPTVAQMVASKNGINFTMMPQSMDIREVVEKEERFYNYCKNAIGASEKVFVLSQDIKDEVTNIFNKEIGNIENKIERLNLGVDSTLFQPTDDKKKSIEMLKSLLSSRSNGKNQKLVQLILQQLKTDISQDEIFELIKKSRIYNNKMPDSDLSSNLDFVDIKKDKVLIFTGRLISQKGVQTIITALPFILKSYPNLKLFIVGAGNLREILEILLWGLREGNQDFVRNIIKWGAKLEGVNEGAFDQVSEFFNQLEIIDMEDEYFENAKKYLKNSSVIFTGLLKQSQLKHLLSCSDIALFPQIDIKTEPLVFLESLSSGCYPIGTDSGGIKEKIKKLSKIVQKGDSEWMKLKPKKESTVSDMMRNIPKALEVCDKYRKDFYRYVSKNHNYVTIAQKLLENNSPVK